MKTSELQGAALDWAVEFALLTDQLPNAEQRRAVASRNQRIKSVGFSTDWSLMGPIIEREFITLDYDCFGPQPIWIGTHHAFDGTRGQHRFGDSPLVAAARAYVASQLGDEVPVPDELLEF
jgi:hypothetical protein